MALAAGILVKEIKAINDHSVANTLPSNFRSFSPGILGGGGGGGG